MLPMGPNGRAKRRSVFTCSGSSDGLGFLGPIQGKREMVFARTGISWAMNDVVPTSSYTSQ